MTDNLNQVVFSDKGIYYLGKELDNRQKITVLIKAIVDNNQEFIQNFVDHLLSDGFDMLPKLWPEIIVNLNSFECVYEYAKLNFDNNTLDLLTNWVVDNSTPKQAERFATNIPYVDFDVLEPLILEKKGLTPIGSSRKTKFGEISLQLCLDPKEIKRLTDYVIATEDMEGIYNFAKSYPQANNINFQAAFIKKSIKENNLKYLYKFARDIEGVNKRLFEMGFRACYHNLEEHEQFLQAEYLFKYQNDIDGVEPGSFSEYLYNSRNHEYMAYQIVYNDDEELLEKTFGNYQNLFRFSLSCKDFFGDKTCYEEYIEKLHQKFIDTGKKLAKKR